MPISQRHTGPSVPKSAGATARTTAAAPPALDVLLAALKSAAIPFAAGSTGSGATVTASTAANRAGSVGPPRLPAQPLIATATLTGFRLCNAHYAATTSPATTNEKGAAPCSDNPALADPCSAGVGTSFLPGRTTIAAFAGPRAQHTEVGPFTGRGSGPTLWPLRVPAKAAGATADFALVKRPVVTVFPGQPIAPAPAAGSPLALGRGGVGGSSAFAPVAPRRTREGQVALLLWPFQPAWPS